MAGQAFSILNNFSSANAQRNSVFARNKLSSNLGHLSSGTRITNAGDDAAGLMIANGLRADYNALSQATRNANDGLGIAQIADGAFSRMGDMLNRATTLAAQASSETIGDTERDIVNTEYQEIMKEIDRVVDTTHFKGELLFSPDAPVKKELFVGDTHIESSINLSIGGAEGAGTEAMGLSNTSLSTVADAKQSLSLLKNAIGKVSEWRGTIGAQSNRLENSIGIIQVQSQNLLAAESAIRDTNMAEEFGKFTSNKILLESSMATIAQANVSSAMILSLFK